MADQIDNLILRTQGENEVKRLQAALEAEEAALRRAVAAHGVHDAASRAAAAQVLALSNQVRAAEGNLSRMGGGVGGASRNLLTFGRVLDDTQQFQYGVANGLRAVANNLVEINPKLGIAAVALGVLATQWTKIDGLVEGSRFEEPWRDLNGILTEVGRSMGFVASEAKKAVEATKLAVTDLAKIQDPAAARRGKAVTSVIERFGGGPRVTGMLQEAARAQGQDPDAIVRQLNEAQQGDEGALGNVQALLRRSGGRAGLFGNELSGELARTDPNAVAAAKEVEEQSKLAQAEAAAANEARRKRIDDTAKTLAAGSLGTAALGGSPIDASRVQEQLATSGEDVSLEFAEEIRQALGTVVEGMASDRALAEGISPESAAGAIRDERLARIKQEAEGQEKERAAALQKRVGAAKEQGADLVAGAAARGGADAARISQYLQAQGLDKDTADALAKDADTGARRDRLGNLLEGEKPRSSEVLEGASIADAIQKGVGGEADHGKQTVTELREIKQMWQRFIQQPAPGVSVRLRRA
jgi:hypothetical protein